MPRDNDRGGRGRPPGGERGRGGPPRGGKPFSRDNRGRSDDRPRGKGRGERDGAGDRGKRFGAAKPEGRSYGDKKRSFGGERRDGDRPRSGAKPGGRPRRDDSPRGEFNREERGPRKFDRPKFERPKFDRSGGERSSGDRPRGERPFRDRPRGDRPADRPFHDRGPRDDNRAAERPRFSRDRREGPRERSGDDRPRGERPFRDRPRDGDRTERPRFSRDRNDRPRTERSGDDRHRGDRPFRDRPRGDRPADRPFRDRGPRDTRPRDNDRSERPRFSRDSQDRPRGDRPRDERSRDDRPRDGQRRNDRVARSSHAWRDHPRSERIDAPAERQEDTLRSETGERREYQPRPAFGGRGAYRERKPFSRDGRERRDAAPPLPKKSGERIAKLMARAGLCSRREAEEWIRQGRVAVNGRVIDSPALDIVERDIVAVDGVPLPERERTRLFLYHKPRGLVTTHSDPEGRATIFDNLPQDLPRLISVGRLDYNTEGLLLLTNDGGLKRTLELPDTGWLRRYRVRAHGEITQGRLDGLRDGIEVDGVKYGPIEATLDSEQGANVWITFAIREGKNREVRNVLSALGLEVNRLIRVSYGPFQLGELAEGAVEEIRGRHLRDQLGERIAKQSGADFSLPVREHDDASDEDEAPARPQREDLREPRVRDERPRRDNSDGKPKPKGRAGLIADSKGRRVLVQRLSDGEPRDGGRPRRPPGRYKGKRERDKRDE
jgi:23S rRNA pseudouridine2605 synthase